MRELATALRAFLVLTLLTGVIYPLIVTGFGQAFFRDQANGSMVRRDTEIVGSRLIGQSFTEDKYFWSRPSGTAPFPYNASGSSGSNLGPTNPALIGGKDADGKPMSGAISDRVTALKSAGADGATPTDLVTASGSGLDPHISPAAAEFQVMRVARARNMADGDIRNLIKAHTSDRQFGILGEPVVNVLELNLALDGGQ